MIEPSRPIPSSNPETSVAPLLSIKALKKSFGSKEVLKDVTFDVPKGGIVSILGRSGTGKSVLLRCVVGLHTPDNGSIYYNNQNVSEPIHREALRRASSYVFQQNALFDSATVLENMLLPLRAHAVIPSDKQTQKARELLHLMELEDASSRYPAELSGGMQKRLAVARALVTDPEVVFFDEPTAGLDPVRRNAVFAMIAQIQRKRGFTAVLVTHDVQEALIVSSRIVWLDGGHTLFSGSTQEFESNQDPRFTQFRDNLEALRQSLR